MRVGATVIRDVGTIAATPLPAPPSLFLSCGCPVLRLHLLAEPTTPPVVALAGSPADRVRIGVGAGVRSSEDVVDGREEVFHG